MSEDPERSNENKIGPLALHAHFLLTFRIVCCSSQALYTRQPLVIRQQIEVAMEQNKAQEVVGQFFVQLQRGAGFLCFGNS